MGSATPTPRRWPISTPTSPRPWTGSRRAQRARRSGRRATAQAGTSPSGAAFDRRVRATVCWYPTGLDDGKLGADPDAGSLARAGEIGGDLLLVFGARDPHTPPAAREAVRRGVAGLRATWLEFDAEHAFGRDVGSRFDPEATDEAFAATVAFFRRSLASTPA